MARIDEVTVCLATTRVLLGMDFKEIDIVIFASPFNDVAALLQGGGRGGRRRLDSKRGQVQVYQLYNSSDYGANMNLTSAMAQLCKSADTSCTTKQLREHFAVPIGTNVEDLEKTWWCCHFCDLASAQAS